MLGLVALPSSSTLLVAACSAGGGFVHGAAAALGIIIADVLFVVLAMLGMSALAQGFGNVFAVVKILAALYLFYIGWRLWHAAWRPAARSLPGSALAGAVIILMDVKAVIFYASLLPLFVDLSSLTVAGGAAIIAITPCCVGGVKLVYAALAQLLRQRGPGPGARAQVLSGLGLMALSAALCFRYLRCKSAKKPANNTGHGGFYF